MCQQWLSILTTGNVATSFDEKRAYTMCNQPYMPKVVPLDGQFYSGQRSFHRERLLTLFDEEEDFTRTGSKGSNTVILNINTKYSKRVVRFSLNDQNSRNCESHSYYAHSLVLQAWNTSWPRGTMSGQERVSFSGTSILNPRFMHPLMPGAERSCK